MFLEKINILVFVFKSRSILVYNSIVVSMCTRSEYIIQRIHICVNIAKTVRFRNVHLSSIIVH